MMVKDYRGNKRIEALFNQVLSHAYDAKKFGEEALVMLEHGAGRAAVLSHAKKGMAHIEKAKKPWSAIPPSYEKNYSAEQMQKAIAVLERVHQKLTSAGHDPSKRRTTYQSFTKKMAALRRSNPKKYARLVALFKGLTRKLKRMKTERENDRAERLRAAVARLKKIVETGKVEESIEAGELLASNIKNRFKSVWGPPPHDRFIVDESGHFTKETGRDPRRKKPKTKRKMSASHPMRPYFAWVKKNHSHFQKPNGQLDMKRMWRYWQKHHA
jgi:hypothetical protein